MGFGGGVSVGHINGSEQLNYDEDTDLVKNVLNTTKGSTDTTNSGSTNTTHGISIGGTNGSTNTMSTDASKNTTVVGPSSSNTSTFNSGRIDTSQVMMTDEAVKHITDQMMESTQGLAAVSKGQNMSGGYNTTANTLITNDLMSRIAGEVAVRGAKTVNTIGSSTSSSNTQNSGATTTQNIGATNTTQNIGATSTFNNSDVTNIIGGSTSHTDSVSEMIGQENSQQTTVGSKDKETKQTEAKAESKWILCTELYLQGRMPARSYLYGSKAFAKYDEQGKKGYYIWAVPALKHLRKHPHSILSQLICITMNARAAHLAAENGCARSKKSILGFIVKHGLYAICWTLSRTIAKNYKSPQFTIQGVTP